MTQPEVIYEDSRMLIINKPAGMVVNEAESVKTKTVQGWAARRLKIESVKTNDTEMVKRFKKRAGVAHRLDKETSGCLVIGKDPESLKMVMEQFRKRKVKKEYVALVHGKLSPKEGTIRLPIGRSTKNRHKFEVRIEGKQAETRWKVEKNGEREGRALSLVRLWPKTGRTHQLRVHLKHINHPLFADERYLNKKQRVGERQELNRHFLHAAKITLRSPENKLITIEAKLPKELKKIVDKYCAT